MAVDVQSISKSFGSLRAVEDLSFTVPNGVVTGFLGPNGAGKSTAMRLMLGLDHGEGRTLFDDRPLTDHPHCSSVVGTHLDARPFLPGRTARDHLRMIASDRQLPKSRIDEVLELVGLTEVAGKRPKGFSLGMAQRLGLAGAVLADPSTLMLDEPANGLDPQSIQWLRQFLKHYASQGKAVLVSSHLLSEMQMMADQIIVIAKGKLIAAGTVDDLLAQRSDVLVRCSDPRALQQKLTDVSSQLEGDDGLSVTGPAAGQIGQAAYDAGLVVRELAVRRASLEDTFFALTGDEQQFAFQPVQDSASTQGGAQ